MPDVAWAWEAIVRFPDDIQKRFQPLHGDAADNAYDRRLTRLIAYELFAAFGYRWRDFELSNILVDTQIEALLELDLIDEIEIDDHVFVYPISAHGKYVFGKLIPKPPKSRSSRR